MVHNDLKYYIVLYKNICIHTIQTNSHYCVAECKHSSSSLGFKLNNMSGGFIVA